MSACLYILRCVCIYVYKIHVKTCIYLWFYILEYGYIDCLKDMQDIGNSCRGGELEGLGDDVEGRIVILRLILHYLPFTF